MDAVTALCGAVLAVAAAGCIFRLWIGPRTADRVIALDTFLLVGVAGLGLLAARTRNGLFVDVALAVSLLGFVGTATVAAFIERPRRHAQEDSA